jgi:predicted  nucleic acid-binding Zn-ribbon protein
MPHQCVRCNQLYEDGDATILKGCSCGAKIFFFIRKDKLEQSRKEIEVKLSDTDKKQIETDVYDLMDAEPDKPVVLDFESIRVLQPGKYELDVVKLFKKEAVVFKLEDGKYVIDIPETFHRLKKS